MSTRQLFAALPVATEHASGYTSSRFGPWVDPDRDGCDTRAEVLLAEATVHPRIGPGCRLLGGSWLSPYDAAALTNAAALRVVHQVSLREAWESGAWKWNAATRRAYMNDLNDPQTLIAVSAKVDRIRGEREPAQWLPRRSDICAYYASWVEIKWRWHLSVDKSEKAAIGRGLAACGWPNIQNPSRR